MAAYDVDHRIIAIARIVQSITITVVEGGETLRGIGQFKANQFRKIWIAACRPFQDVFRYGLAIVIFSRLNGLIVICDVSGNIGPGNLKMTVPIGTGFEVYRAKDRIERSRPKVVDGARMQS